LCFQGSLPDNVLKASGCTVWPINVHSYDLFSNHDQYDTTHYSAFTCTEQPLQWISSFPCDHKLRLFSVLITDVSTVNILVSINYIMSPDVSVLYKHVQINTLIEISLLRAIKFRINLMSVTCFHPHP